MNIKQLRGMLGAYQQWAKALCAPVFWRRDNGELHNGSMTFVQTPTHVIGVTNAHIADEISECKHGCQVGGAQFDHSRFIARHPTMDLATYRLSDVFMATSLHQAASVIRWPPVPPFEKQPVMYGGYPGMYRVERNGDFEFRFAWFASSVRSASEQNVGMVLEISTSNSVSVNRIPANADLGGWSGGPVFRVVDSGNIERLELAAIIYEYSETFEIALAHPLTDLAPDGTFLS